MKEFRVVVSRRLKLLIGVMALFALVVVAMGFYTYEEQGSVADFVLGLQTGIFVGTLAVLFLKMKKLRAALRNETVLKTLFIEEKDERRLLIEQKANTLSLRVIMYITALAAVVSGFFHVTISLTLFAVLALVALVMTITKLYYNRQY